MSAYEAHLFAQLEELEFHASWPGLGEVAILLRRSPTKPTPNEDSILLVRLSETQAVLAVADGVGGQPRGEQASAQALASLQAELEAGLEAGDSMESSVMTGIDRANQSVLSLGTGGATTLAIVTIDGANIRAYHVGDSGILAIGGQGKLKLETIAHSPVSYGVQAGLIASDDAMDHDERHLVSNVIGDENMYMGVSATLELAQRDRVLLASDGLFDNLPLETVIELLRKGSLESAVHELGSLCSETMLSGGHPDDLSMVVFRLDSTQGESAE